MTVPRQRPEFKALLASTTTAGAVAATNSTAITLPIASAYVFVLDVTAAAGDAADTLDVKVQTLVNATWIDVCSFTQVLGNGGALRHVGKIMSETAQAMFADAALAAGSVRHIFGDQWRIEYVIVDADADSAFTFLVDAMPM